MIQPLRNIHRRVFIALAALLPLILVAALKARHPFPVVSTAMLSVPQYSPPLKQPSVAWNKNSFDTEFYADPNNAEGLLVVLRPRRDLDDPDLLLYWAAGNSPGINAAHLLGSFRAGNAYSLPVEIDRGSLVLYSLAHGEIVDSASIEGLP
jgi:hypothetical protein